MNKSIIIDIDGTITNLDRLTLSSNPCLINTNNSFLNNQIIRKILYLFILYYSKNYKIREHVTPTINKLSDTYDIIFLTKRHFANELDTKEGKLIRYLIEELLRINNIKYNKIIYTKGDKLEECIEYQPEFIIEDSPTNICLLSNFFKVIVIDTPYNRNVEGKNIYRAYNWIDVYNVINNYELGNKSKILNKK